MSAYVLSRRAEIDIQLIWNFIAEDNLDAADRVKDELREAMRKLAQNARHGTPAAGCKK